MYGWWLEELPQDIHCKFKVIGQSINEVIFDTPTTSLIVLMWERTYPCPVSLGILSLWQGIRLHGRYGESLLPQVLGRCLLCIQKHLWTWSDHKGQYWTPIWPVIECTWGPEYARYWRLLNICKPGTLWENILWKNTLPNFPSEKEVLPLTVLVAVIIYCGIAANFYFEWCYICPSQKTAPWAVPIVITWCHKCMSVHWMYTSYSTPFDVGPCMQNLQTKIFVRFVLINKCKKVGIWNFNKIFQVYFTTCVCIAFLTNPCPIQEFYLNFLHGTCMFSTKMYIFVSLKCLHITNLSPHTCDKYEVWSLWDQHFMSLIVFFWNNA